MTLRSMTFCHASSGCSSAGLLLVCGLFVVRDDLDDARRVWHATEVLIEEARAIVPSLPLDRPIVFVRAERISPLHDIATDRSGAPKLFYVRGRDAYGLTDTAALIEWAIARDGIFADWLRNPDRSAAQFAVLLHVKGGFRWLEAPAPTLGATLDYLAGRGLDARVLQIGRTML